MNYGQGKKKVYEILDEHSSGGEVLHDEDIELKLRDFFDTAQKLISKVAPVNATYKIKRKAGQTLYPMPSGFQKLVQVWRNGSPSRKYRFIGGKLQIPESDHAEVMVEYQKLPDTLDESFTDNDDFEVDEEACEAMPYYVAAQVLLPDLMTDYRPYLEEWEKRRAELRERGRIGGAVTLRQSFYRYE